MKSTRSNRRLAAIFAAVLAALAVLALPSMAAAKHSRDRNHDRIPDRWEKRHHLSLTINQAGRDQDRDQLPNRAEFLAGDSPRNADSDGDGIPDGEENAGRIQSFDPASGRLVIGLFNEETVSGQVTEATEIECGHGSASASDAGSGGDEGEDSPGEHEGGEEAGDDDHSGPGEAGDDEAGEEEPGDDDAGEHGETPGPGGEHGNCTTADLTVGAVVDEAELKIEGGVATFEKVELAG